MRCPNCGSENIEFIGKGFKTKTPLHRCKQCGVYITPNLRLRARAMAVGRMGVEDGYVISIIHKTGDDTPTIKIKKTS